MSQGAVALASQSDEEYIVQVPDGQLATLTSTLSALGETPLDKYSQGVDGALISANSTIVQQLSRALPQATITRNKRLRLADATQTAAPWHLTALNDTSTSSTPTTYRYPTASTQDVDVYVIDTGIDISSYDTSAKELWGHVSAGHNFVTDTTDPGYNSQWGPTNADDCWTYQSTPDFSTRYWGGHGTHVAGIVASKTYGVAKSAHLIPLRVFGCPYYQLLDPSAPHDHATNPYIYDAGASTSGIIDAIDYAIANKRSGIPSVINMSLGGDADANINLKVQAAISAGFTVVSAAGNSNPQNACDVSPASAPNGITVGAVDPDYSFASYSNVGSCISILAPGTNVRSLAAWNSAGYRLESGTSMATPVVSGIAAMYLANNPSATPAQVKAAILANAVTDLATSVPTGTTNKLANTLWLLDVRVASTTGLTTGTITPTSVRLSWDPSSAENDSGPTAITDYTIRYRKFGTTAWTTRTHTPSSSTSFTVSSLTPKQRYEFTVAAVAGITRGEFSTITEATTLSGIPSAVTSLRASTISRYFATLTWGLPLTLNGGAIKDYIVYYRKSGSSTWIRFYDAVTTTRSVTVTVLRPGTSYYIKVAPKTAYGIGPYATRWLRTNP